MKNTYVLKVIENKMYDNYIEYNNAIENAEPIYFNGLQEMFSFIGGKLPRVRCGYAGKDLKYIYTAHRV